MGMTNRETPDISCAFPMWQDADGQWRDFRDVMEDPRYLRDVLERDKKRPPKGMHEVKRERLS